MMQPKAFGYCRLSKDETTITCAHCRNEWSMKIESTDQTQFDCPFCDHTFTWDKRDPISIQAQTDTILRLAMERLPRSVDTNMEIVADINVSGEIPIRDREQGGLLFKKLRSGDYLIVAKLDRAFRDLEDCCRQLKFFVRTGIRLIIGDMPDMDIHTPAGRMCLQMMAMFAEFERQRISERTKAGLAKRKALGLPHCGPAPRGYDLFCKKCDYKYSWEESCKGKSCPQCKHPRQKFTYLLPNRNEHTLMWRLLWERSGYCWKDWDMVIHDLKIDGHRTREGKSITLKWCRNYFDRACELLAEGKLLLDCRPSKMENFHIGQLVNIPKHVADMLEANSLVEAKA